MDASRRVKELEELWDSPRLSLGLDSGGCVALMTLRDASSTLTCRPLDNVAPVVSDVVVTDDDDLFLLFLRSFMVLRKELGRLLLD